MRGAREEKPRRIGQREVERLLVLREQAREARATAAKKEQELQAEEARLMALLRGGGEVEPGPYFALVITETTARSVAWRQVVEQHLGRDFAAQVLAATSPGERQVLKVLQEVKVDGRVPVVAGAPNRGSDGDGRGDETLREDRDSVPGR